MKNLVTCLISIVIALFSTAAFAANSSPLHQVNLKAGEQLQWGNVLVTCALEDQTPGGCNSYGCWHHGGGECNSYGCYERNGGCNSYGCWSNGGGCNSYGCWNSRNGSCNSYGCTDSGSCNSYGCP